MKYTVVVRGAPPPDLACKIAQAHTEALKAAQTGRKKPEEK